MENKWLWFNVLACNIKCKSNAIGINEYLNNLIKFIWLIFKKIGRINKNIKNLNWIILTVTPQKKILNENNKQIKLFLKEIWRTFSFILFM